VECLHNKQQQSQIRVMLGITHLVASLVGAWFYNLRVLGEGEVQFCGVSSQQTIAITKLGIQYHPLGCINCYLPIFLTGTLLGIFDWGEVKCNVDLQKSTTIAN
jgi:hypothetical protein